MNIHPVVEAAAEGRLPAWARVEAQRRDHMARVVALLDGWAVELGVGREARTRWRAAGWLHDCLRDEEEARLRALVVDPGLSGLPAPVLHGPAASARLRRDGVRDEELLTAVAYHTLGHPAFGPTGRALYAADFLEPGRDLRNRWREGLRARMPGEMEEVVRVILQARIVHLVERRRPVRPETMAFWNRSAGDEAWARASGV